MHLNDDGDGFLLDQSIGALIRFTHRAFAEDLQRHLAEHQVTVGMWYFLRTLWEEDGLTQRELSRRVGVSEPTTLQQLRNMEHDGLIKRRPSTSDRRKVHIHLTANGKRLKKTLLPYAREVNEAGLAGLDRHQIDELRVVLNQIRANLATRAAPEDATRQTSKRVRPKATN